MYNKLIEKLLLLYFFLGFTIYDYINYSDRLITIFPKIEVDIFLFSKY